MRSPGRSGRLQPGVYAKDVILAVIGGMGTAGGTGHAIEFASPLSHGESVALGLVGAARVSESRLGFMESRRVTDCIEGLGLAVEVDGLERKRVMDLLRHDKKRDGQGLRMVLLMEIGQAVLRHVDDDDIDLGLEAVGL